jgi:hypothetical protein
VRRPQRHYHHALQRRRPDGDKRLAGPGQAAQTTVSFYTNVAGANRVWQTLLPDNTVQTNTYYLTGQTKHVAGSREYPVEYTYDYAGRLKTQTTWRDYP